MNSTSYTITIPGKKCGDGLVLGVEAKHLLDIAWRLSRVIINTEFAITDGFRTFFIFKDGLLTEANSWGDFYLGEPDAGFLILKENICTYPNSKTVLKARNYRGFPEARQIFNNSAGD